MTLPDQWPPAVSEVEIQELTSLATTYALSHGLQYLPVFDSQPPAPTSAIHAPLALFPSPFPRSVFLLAQRLQSLYNILYARVATDEQFLDRVMGKIGKIDSFTGNLWRGWKRLRDEGVHQQLHLGIFRSDYMLHAPKGNEDISLKQVEFNTVSSSFGALSQRTSELHSYLLAATNYFDSSPHLKPENLPFNGTLEGVAEGLAEAHKAYGVDGSQILFVVQADERNVFDQRLVEYHLLKKYGIHVTRKTFDQLAGSATVDPSSRILTVTTPTCRAPIQISTVYYRAGYAPTDYPTPSHYETRISLERSRAIKCPSIQLQLAGGKKVQQVLTEPGVLESFLLDKNRWGASAGDITEQDVAAIRDSWMGMWGLDEDGELGASKARANADNLVLKPQREGGGNNVYKSSIPSFLDSLPAEEREVWIAMELIATPDWLGNYLVRTGSGTGGAVKTEVVSELGIFGWALFGPEVEGVKEREVGWLVRTKGKDTNEGGVATGFSVLDSLVLID